MSDIILQSIMKKAFSLLVSLFLTLTGFSQSCLPEGITFTTQAQIDSFQINHPNCTEIEGDVTISGANITNLNGLNVVTHIGGILYVIDNPSLISLSGLEGLNSSSWLNIQDNELLTNLLGLQNLDSILGGYIGYNESLTNLSGLDGIISFEQFFIESNISLSSLSGFENLTTVGEIWIAGNDALTSLSDLSNLTSANNLLIGHNDALSNLNGLEGLSSINGYLRIFANSGLSSLAGLNNLTSIGNFLEISSNSSLPDLTGLNNLTTITNNIVINNNDLLTNLDGLNSLHFVGAGVRITDNDVLNDLTALSSLITIGNGPLEFGSIVYGMPGNASLTSLTGIDNIQAGSISDIFIIDNPSLSICEVRSVCEYLVSPSGYVWIENNAIGCNSPGDVEAACGVGIIDNNTPEPQITINPNPASTAITISLPSTIPVDNTTISIYNVNAQQVLSRPITEPITVLDIYALPRGMYFARVNDGESVMVGKFVKQ